MLGALLPKNPNLAFDLINKLMTKKEISNTIDAVYRHCGQKETVIFCDRIMQLGFTHAFKAGISFGKDDMVIPDTKAKLVEETAAARQGIRAAVQRRSHHPGREVQQGRRRLGEVHRSRRRRDDEAHSGGREGRLRSPEADELDLHDVAFRCPWFAPADEAARRHARPDGQAVGRDHRDADHLELQGRPLGARVLQLDPRRPKGSRGHGVEDRELRLSDAASGRRGAGLHHHRAGLRHDRAASRCRRSSTPVRSSRRSACASSAARPRKTSSRRQPARSSFRRAR